MEGYGIQENVLRWIAKRVEDRKQLVQLSGHKSGWTDFRSSAPQGSVLGFRYFVKFLGLLMT